LHRIGILVFVNHDPLETLLISVPHIGELFQQQHGQQQHVAEIKGVALFQAFLVGAVDLDNFCVIDIARSNGVDVLWHESAVFIVVDPGADDFGRILLVIQIQFFEHIL